MLENYFRIRVANPDSMKSDSFRTVWIDKEKKAKAVMAVAKDSDKRMTQSYFFDKEIWTPEKAREWIKSRKGHSRAEMLNDKRVLITAKSVLCSEMPNLKIMMSNVAAALNQTRLSLDDSKLLNRYALETSSEYCAGCAGICEAALETKVPVCDTMRYLMYARFYKEPGRASAAFQKIPPSKRRQMASIDYTRAEAVCPQGMPIERLMKEAVKTL